MEGAGLQQLNPAVMIGHGRGSINSKIKRYHEAGEAEAKAKMTALGSRQSRSPSTPPWPHFDFYQFFFLVDFLCTNGVPDFMNVR